MRINNNEIINKRFGRLVTIKEAEQRGKRRFFLCKCDCGGEIIARIDGLRGGHSKSCGCYSREMRSENSKTHGLSKSRIYSIHAGIKARCNNKNDTSYFKYGGRGISICKEWANDFMAFYKWAMANGYSDNLTIDRIDNEAGYSPENCRFSNLTIQSTNTRMKVTNTSGFRGVSWNKNERKWKAYITMEKKRVLDKCFKTKEEAVKARNYFIIFNGLPHKLNRIETK